MKLKLSRPLVFFDIEATGVNVTTDRIVEICVIKLGLDGQQEERTRRLNPGQPIPPEATAIHGITDADVANEPTFRNIAHSLDDFLRDCDLAGFNIIRFDVPLLVNEFERCQIDFRTDTRRLIDAQRIYHRREPRTLSAAVQFYCGREHHDAHGASADVLATIDVLAGQLERYSDLPSTIDELDMYCRPQPENAVDRDGKLLWNANGEVVLGFGASQGRPLREVAADDRGLLEWILRSRFSAEVKEVVGDALQGRFQHREP